MPNTYYAPYGRQKDSFAEPAGGNCGPRPLGSLLVLPDNRTFCMALAGAAARVAGKLNQSVVPVAEHFENVVSTIPAVGDTTIAATLGATLAAIDIYSEGMVHLNKSTGLDYGHRIRRAITEGRAHAAVASSGIITVSLEIGESVDVAGISTTEASFTRNRFHATIIHDSPPTAQLAGVSVGIAAASRYYYEQVLGMCAVTADGAVVVGDFVVPSATVDGTVMPSAAFETDGPYVGICGKANITAETAIIDLKLGY